MVIILIYWQWNVISYITCFRLFLQTCLQVDIFFSLFIRTSKILSILYLLYEMFFIKLWYAMYCFVFCVTSLIRFFWCVFAVFVFWSVCFTTVTEAKIKSFLVDYLMWYCYDYELISSNNNNNQAKEEQKKTFDFFYYCCFLWKKIHIIT